MGLRIVFTQQSFKTFHLPCQLLSSNLVVFLRTYSTIQSGDQLFFRKVYIHGGSFMLGGYIGAGPRKLLERDMVKSSFLTQNLQTSAFNLLQTSDQSDRCWSPCNTEWGLLASSVFLTIKLLETLDSWTRWKIIWHLVLSCQEDKTDQFLLSC